MSFSDDDLKRLKEVLPLIETYGRWLTNREKIEALLARLEAAERVIEKSGCGCCADYEELRNAKQDWRASKGALYADEKQEYKARKAAGKVAS